MMPVVFARSGPNLKPVAFCDYEGCTAFAPFGIDSYLGRAIDQKDAKKAGKHFCADHVPALATNTNPYMGE